MGNTIGMDEKPLKSLPLHSHNMKRIITMVLGIFGVCNL